jgi:hypothetical protein
MSDHLAEGPSSDPASPTPGEGSGYRIGAEVAGSDGPLGRLIWVTLDPLGRRLTHLAVEPAHRVGLARLVPVERVSSAGPPIRVGLDQEGFDRLDEAEETWFIPYQAGADDFVGPASAMAWPYFGVAGAGTGIGGLASPLVSDKVPLGEVEVRRGDRVRASDADIGRVQGLVVDPTDYHVTHVLLEEGHLWGRKQVAIPIRVVRSREGRAIEVALSAAEIRDLPPVELSPGTPAAE